MLCFCDDTWGFYGKKQILQENHCGTGKERSSVQYDFKVLEYIQGSICAPIPLVSNFGYLMKKLLFLFQFCLFINSY